MWRTEDAAERSRALPWSLHRGFRGRIVVLACLVAPETGFIADSYDYFDEDAKCGEVGVWFRGARGNGHLRIHLDNHEMA